MKILKYVQWTLSDAQGKCTGKCIKVAIIIIIII